MSQQTQALSEGEQAALAEQTQPTETEVAELQTGESVQAGGQCYSLEERFTSSPTGFYH